MKKVACTFASVTVSTIHRVYRSTIESRSGQEFGSATASISTM